ncbi:hypothetical protein [Acidilobus sp.]|uniref:hypothetical protein n=1 Tax=Acidilobus sp. TaxID=1872109 RepID=UPI003D01A774
MVQGLAFFVSLAWALATHHVSPAEMAGTVGASMIDDVVIAAVPLLMRALKAAGIVKGSGPA